MGILIVTAQHVLGGGGGVSCAKDARGGGDAVALGSILDLSLVPGQHGLATGGLTIALGH